MLQAWNTRDVGYLFRSIGRYTRLVGLFKIILTLFALLIVVSVIAIPILNSGERGARLVFMSIEKSAATEKPRMMRLRYQGIDEKDQPFTVTAEYGIQVDEDNLELYNPTADVFLKEGKWIALTASHGFINIKTKLVDIKGSVDVFYDNGYEFSTEEVHVDIDRKQMTSEVVVKGQGPAGTLEAEGGMIATQGNGRILFKGPVRMTIYMGGKS